MNDQIQRQNEGYSGVNGLPSTVIHGHFSASGGQSIGSRFIAMARR
jgi:hypothetical protein